MNISSVVLYLKLKNNSSTIVRIKSYKCTLVQEVKVMAFADRLKEFREKEKLSQADFAKMIGISTRTLVHYEDGERYPRDVEVYKKIAEVMDCDYNYLLEESDEFLNRVYNMGGKRELEKARALTEGLSSLFAGGEISDEDKDAAFEAITRAYWEAKRENKKYGRKKKD